MRRSMGRRGNSNSGGGPLLTGHLKDIDLELELLKRKREMIEQQQQLLVMEQQFKSSRHSYDQLRYDEPNQHGSNRDYTHLYETGPKHRTQFGRKRQAENQWQYDSAPKRTPPKKKNQSQSQFNQQGSGNAGSGNFRNQRPQGQGSKNSPRAPAPLMDIKISKQSIGQKIANQKALPKTTNKDFAPSKVSKPKAPPAPNNLASLPVTERKSLVAAATESDGDVSRMLLPDRVPSQQVSGRLELALGAIMKNIRALINGQPQHATMLRSIQLQRVMKQAIRERIRNVMLGKVVGSLIDILAIYREEFPEETDADILNIALEAGGVSAPDQKLKTKFIESGDPGEFFKINMSSLLETQLNEMFSKIEDIYNSAPASDAPSDEQIDLQKNADNKNKEASIQEYKDFLNSSIKVFDVKRVLPKLMKRYIPYIIKLLNLDGIYQSTKAAITIKANEKAANISETKGTEQGQGDGNASAITSNDKRPMYNLPYYVKIMGRPTLPKRKVMQGFLSQFNPKSIKKHRTIHNLLFVGFTEKTDFDNMVGADGTVIGRSTLSVRICSKGTSQDSNAENGENNETPLANDAIQDEVKTEEQKDGELISSELDGQITDLLSAIRKSEEEEIVKKENVEETGGDDCRENVQTVSEQAENDSEAVKMEKRDEDVINKAIDNNEMNEAADNNEINEATDNNEMNEAADNNEMNEDADNDRNDEIVDEEVPEGNLEDDNAASQETSDDVESQNSKPGNEAETQNAEVTDQVKTDISSDEAKKQENSQETNEVETLEDTQQPSEKTPTKTEEQSNDKVGELKNATGRSTPSRMSTRLANVTPSSIRTRRASKLASQN